MVELTQRQRELIRHAVGLDGRNKTTYRNHYVVGKGSDGFDDWMDLVKKGYAKHADGSPISGGNDVFWVTRETALAVRNRDEPISLETNENPQGIPNRLGQSEAGRHTPSTTKGNE